MTPKEKAIDLYEKFYKLYPNQDAQFIAAECALIAVDEIIEYLVDLSNGEFIFIYQVNYWKEVKKEIENL